MAKTTVAIIGSGIAGTTLAHLLTQRGIQVDVFEKGPDYPYPHEQQYVESTLYRSDVQRAWRLPEDLQWVGKSGDYRSGVNEERTMLVGGSCTFWGALTLRMAPGDFKRRSKFGFGDDWPIAYEDLEPYYCRAEDLIGVAGTDEDNPHAPDRSRPYPLPAFELSYADKWLASKFADKGISWHTSPQARNPHEYDGRQPCINFGTCSVCPIGARYSPNVHLQRAVETGLCNVHTDGTVRRIVVEGGKGKAIVVQPNEGGPEVEHAADVVILAAGAIESARALLLSTSAAHPDGLGNASGQVGRNLVFHHLWAAPMMVAEKLYPGRFGGQTGQTAQYRDPAGPGHGGVKVELAPGEYALELSGVFRDRRNWKNADDVIAAVSRLPSSVSLIFHAESTPSSSKYLKLSDRKDRFGDAFAHVHYELSGFDRTTYGHVRGLVKQFTDAIGPVQAGLWPIERFSSAYHHMGTCRMGTDPSSSVVDSLGQVHGTDNVYLAGSSIFTGSSGAINPTLTIVALAIRTADALLERLRP